jgi:hypothetical protein
MLVPYTSKREPNMPDSVLAESLLLESWLRHAQIVVLRGAPIAGQRRSGFNDATGPGQSKQNVFEETTHTSSGEEWTFKRDSIMVASIILPFGLPRSDEDWKSTQIATHGFSQSVPCLILWLPNMTH